MRIALLASCKVTVPPRAYGRTEVVIAELAKMLSRLGHSVVLYGSTDSRPACALQPRFPSGCGPELEQRHFAHAWGDIAARAAAFDIVHAHHAPALALRGALRVPTVFTVHHDRDDALVQHYAEFPDVRYVALSDGQVERMPELNIAAVVHAGLDPDLYPASRLAGTYCLFLGKLTRERAAHRALDAARLAALPIEVGAAEHATDPAYFEEEIGHRLDAGCGAARWRRELSPAGKLSLLQNARALLVPDDRDDPSGLGMIEAMLTGTPVVAFARGCAPEMIEEGVTGFVVRDVREMAARLRQVGAIDRVRCRARAVERWSSLRMASAYEGIYEDVLRARRQHETRPQPAAPAAAGQHKPRFSGLFSPLWTA